MGWRALLGMGLCVLCGRVGARRKGGIGGCQGCAGLDVCLGGVWRACVRLDVPVGCRDG